MPAIELEDPARDVVEEVPVVRDRDDRAGIRSEVMLEPRDRFRIQVVRRLVEEQQVRSAQQQAAERDAPALAARQPLDCGIGRRQPKRIHRLFELRVQLPCVRLVDTILDASLLVQHLLHLVG